MQTYETKTTNPNNDGKKLWINRPATDLAGQYGEQLVFDYLKSRSWNVYTTNHEDGSHFTDAITQRLNKETNMIDEMYIEVKTKPRMLYYNATGFDKNNLYYYHKLNAMHPLYVFFVDYLTKGIYSASLTNLQKNITSIKNQPDYIQLYDYACLTKVRDLTPPEIKILKELENNNY